MGSGVSVDALTEQQKAAVFDRIVSNHPAFQGDGPPPPQHPLHPPHDDSDAWEAGVCDLLFSTSPADLLQMMDSGTIPQLTKKADASSNPSDDDSSSGSGTTSDEDETSVDTAEDTADEEDAKSPGHDTTDSSGDDTQSSDESDAYFNDNGDGGMHHSGTFEQFDLDGAGAGAHHVSLDGGNDLDADMGSQQRNAEEVCLASASSATSTAYSIPESSPVNSPAMGTPVPTRDSRGVPIPALTSSPKYSPAVALFNRDGVLCAGREGGSPASSLQSGTSPAYAPSAWSLDALPPSPKVQKEISKQLKRGTRGDVSTHSSSSSVSSLSSSALLVPPIDPIDVRVWTGKTKKKANKDLDLLRLCIER
jgi:hypothetical protein